MNGKGRKPAPMRAVLEWDGLAVRERCSSGEVYPRFDLPPMTRKAFRDYARRNGYAAREVKA